MAVKPILIATPISHLCDDSGNHSRLLAFSDCFEGRDRALTSPLPRQFLFHSELSLIMPWHDADHDTLQRVKETKPELRMISFHLAACYDRPVIVDNQYQPGGRRFSAEEMLTCAAENVRWLRRCFDPNLEIAVENNNYYATSAYETVTEPAFITEIVTVNNLAFLFDITHARIAAINRGVPEKTIITALPLDRCRQIHVSDYSLRGNVAWDTHEPPRTELYEQLKNLLPCLPHLGYVTVEYYQSLSQLESITRRIKEIIA